MKNSQGVLVGEVNQGGLAEIAGVKPGDLIIAYNDFQIKKASDLFAVVDSSKESTNDNILLVLRDGVENKLNVNSGDLGITVNYKGFQSTKSNVDYKEIQSTKSTVNSKGLQSTKSTGDEESNKTGLMKLLDICAVIILFFGVVASLISLLTSAFVTNLAGVTSLNLIGVFGSLSILITAFVIFALLKVIVMMAADIKLLKSKINS